MSPLPDFVSTSLKINTWYLISFIWYFVVNIWLVFNIQHLISNPRLPWSLCFVSTSVKINRVSGGNYLGLVSPVSATEDFHFLRISTFWGFPLFEHLYYKGDKFIWNLDHLGKGLVTRLLCQFLPLWCSIGKDFHYFI